MAGAAYDFTRWGEDGLQLIVGQILEGQTGAEESKDEQTTHCDDDHGFPLLLSSCSCRVLSPLLYKYYRLIWEKLYNLYGFP